MSPSSTTRSGLYSPTLTAGADGDAARTSPPATPSPIHHRCYPPRNLPEPDQPVKGRAETLAQLLARARERGLHLVVAHELLAAIAKGGKP